MCEPGWLDDRMLRIPLPWVSADSIGGASLAPGSDCSVKLTRYYAAAAPGAALYAAMALAALSEMFRRNYKAQKVASSAGNRKSVKKAPANQRIHTKSLMLVAINGVAWCGSLLAFPFLTTNGVLSDGRYGPPSHLINLINMVSLFMLISHTYRALLRSASRSLMISRTERYGILKGDPVVDVCKRLSTYCSYIYLVAMFVVGLVGALPSTRGYVETPTWLLVAYEIMILGVTIAYSSAGIIVLRQTSKLLARVGDVRSALSGKMMSDPANRRVAEAVDRIKFLQLVLWLTVPVTSILYFSTVFVPMSWFMMLTFSYLAASNSLIALRLYWRRRQDFSGSQGSASRTGTASLTPTSPHRVVSLPYNTHTADSHVVSAYVEGSQYESAVDP